MRIQLSALWESSPQFTALEVIGNFLFAVMMYWLTINSTDTQIIHFANIYLMMSVLSLIVFLGRPLKFFHTVELGKSKNNIFIGLLAGAIVALVLMNGTGFTIFPVTFNIGGGNTFNPTAILLGVFAGIAEARFFRGCLTPTLTETTHNQFIGKGTSITTFGLFHFVVYGFSVPLMVLAMAAAVIFEFGNQLLQSTSFEYGMHPVWNALKVPGVTKLLFAPFGGGF